MCRSIKSACHALKEPKHQVMRRVFDQTGEEFVFTLIEQVEKVEEAGGQFVADGTRRRTKGGVFFNLLKAKISKEQWDYIFEEERAIQVCYSHLRGKDIAIKQILTLTPIT